MLKRNSEKLPTKIPYYLSKKKKDKETFSRNLQKPSETSTKSLKKTMESMESWNYCEYKDVQKILDLEENRTRKWWFFQSIYESIIHELMQLWIKLKDSRLLNSYNIRLA